MHSGAISKPHLSIAGIFDERYGFFDENPNLFDEFLAPCRK
jgi:hypothetical protein